MIKHGEVWLRYIKNMNTSRGALMRFQRTTSFFTLDYPNGDLEFAGHSSARFMDVVQIDDSVYIYHRFHHNAHLSKYLECVGFSSWGGSKTNWLFLK
jgi:hypothetical protein